MLKYDDVIVVWNGCLGKTFERPEKNHHRQRRQLVGSLKLVFQKPREEEH